MCFKKLAPPTFISKYNTSLLSDSTIQTGARKGPHTLILMYHNMPGFAIIMISYMVVPICGNFGRVFKVEGTTSSEVAISLVLPLAFPLAYLATSVT